MIHWRRKWQPTPVSSPGENNEQYEKLKKKKKKGMTPENEPPGQKVPNLLLGKGKGELIVALQRMKCLGQSRRNVQLWMFLVV